MPSQLKHLLWKNYKVLRRTGLVAFIIMPAVFMSLLALLHAQFDIEKFSAVVFDLNTLLTSNISVAAEGNNDDKYWISEAPSTNLLSYTESLLCSKNLPPYSVAIVPNPSLTYSDSSFSETAFEHFQNLIDALNDSYTSSLAASLNINDSLDFSEDLYSLSSYNSSQLDDCYFMYDKLPFVDGMLIEFFDSEDDLESRIEANNYGVDYSLSDASGSSGSRGSSGSSGSTTRPIGLALVLDSISDDGLQWSYTLRINESQAADTTNFIDIFDRDYYQLLDQSAYRYLDSGFTGVQRWIDAEILRYAGGGNGTDLDAMQVKTFPFPLQSYEFDNFWTFFVGLLFFFLFLTFMIPLNQVMTVMVAEKERKIKPVLEIMGASKGTIWLSHFVSVFGLMLVMSGLMTMIAYVGQVFRYSNGFIVFLWLFGAAASLGAFAMFASNFFSKVKTVQNFAWLIWGVQIYLGYPGLLTNAPGAIKTLLCILPGTCFSISCNNLLQYESNLIGVQWDNVNDEFEEFTFVTSLYFYLLDFVLYLIATLFIDGVYTLQDIKNAFAKCKGEASNGPEAPQTPLAEMYRKESEAKMAENEENEVLNFKNYEKESNADATIKIRKLKKHFDDGKVRAVNGVSLDMYAGQVFCLLGHNGAGKTTTINMLTGMLDITDGNAWLLGQNVKDAMLSIRESKMLSICPQHDVLIEELTVREHLEFFLRLKSSPEELRDTTSFDEKVNKMLESVELADKSKEQPKKLSGGMKRKLSLAISLIGDSKIIFLDEPTTGMDAQARRNVWELVEKVKQDNRTIILTTHLMDEADYLGDRIAIMHGGRVECCGSSLFLKRLYHVGYTFTIQLKNDVSEASESKSDPGDAGDALDAEREVTALICNHINDSKLVSSSRSGSITELEYQLPFEESSKFAVMLNQLDSTEVAINTYGISVTTLEEVFFKIGEMAAAHDEADGKSEDAQNAPPDDLESDLESGVDLEEFQLEMLTWRGEAWVALMHVYNVMYRRWYVSIRDRKGLLHQIFLPVLFTSIGLLLTLIAAAFEDAASQPSLDLTVRDVMDVNNVADKYLVPMVNITDISVAQSQGVHTASNLILDDYNVWEDVFETYLRDDFGQFQYFDVPLATLDSDGTAFMDLLLDESKPRYNGMYLPNILQNDSVMLGVNISAYHSYPVSFNLLTNWVAKTQLGSEASVKVASHPLPLTKREIEDATNIGNDIFAGVLPAVYILLGFSNIAQVAMAQIAADKEKGRKDQQIVSGINVFSYWFGNWLVDLISSMPASILLIVLVFIFGVESFYQNGAVGVFLVSILLFTMSATSFTYLLSFLVKKADIAETVVTLLYSLLSMVLIALDFVLELIESTKELNNDVLRPIYRIFPFYLLADNLVQIGTSDEDTKLWDADVCGDNLVYMFVEAAGYLLLVVLIEYLMQHQAWFATCLVGNVDVSDGTDAMSDVDEDVRQEQKRIEAIAASGSDGANGKDIVTIAGLSKVYNINKIFCIRNKPEAHVKAVKNIWYGVSKGEIFGFLGVNGAGKTTTMKMLTGHESVTAGNAFISGYSVSSSQNVIHKLIGYCPQFDCLYDLLTAREHLYFYGRLKGLTGDKLIAQTKLLLSQLNLTEYSDVRAGTFSGGNKRKLSVGISMIGNPPIVLLDEPSTGVDPVSRRQMQTFIKNTMKNRCVILTTHSMEECEKLANRITIMVDGKLKCIGSAQHLKSKFGAGFQLDLTLSVDYKDLDNDDETETKSNGINYKDEIERRLSEMFEFKCVDANRRKLTYQIDVKSNEKNVSNEKMKLSQLFEFLESMKKQIDVMQQYAVSQPTLEQIFLHMARNNSNEADENENENEKIKDDATESTEKIAGGSRQDTETEEYHD